MKEAIYLEIRKYWYCQHLMKGPDKPKCTKSISNYIGFLFLGTRYIEGKYTCLLIHCFELPWHRNVTYCRIVCDIRYQNKETYRFNITIGSNKLTQSVSVSILNAYLTTSKLHCNIILLTPDTRYLIVDVKNFYFNSQINKNKYYNIFISRILKEIINKYDLLVNQIDGYVYVRL